MGKYAKFDEFQHVRLKGDRPSVSEFPSTNLDTPRAVTTKDQGIIVDVHDVERPGYEVEFFDIHGKIINFLTLREEEIEP